MNKIYIHKRNTRLEEYFPIFAKFFAHNFIQCNNLLKSERRELLEFHRQFSAPKKNPKKLRFFKTILNQSWSESGARIWFARVSTRVISAGLFLSFSLSSFLSGIYTCILTSTYYWISFLLRSGVAPSVSEDIRRPAARLIHVQRPTEVNVFID